jgi:hypothetical protein
MSGSSNIPSHRGGTTALSAESRVKQDSLDSKSAQNPSSYDKNNNNAYATKNSSFVPPGSSRRGAANTSNNQDSALKLNRPLIKQVSLSNPPNYDNLNEKGDFLSSSNNKTFTSRNNNNPGGEVANYFSSPSSSISQINTATATTTTGARSKERMQDPASLLRKVSATFNNNNNSSGGSSMLPPRISKQNAPPVDEMDLFEMSNNRPSGRHQANTPNNKLLPNSAINNRSAAASLMHNDSLSSDPSDVNAMKNTNSHQQQEDMNRQYDDVDFDPSAGNPHLSRRQSSKKRIRKQPPVPGVATNHPNVATGNLNTNMSTNAANAINKSMGGGRQSLVKQQHSFTSSDDETMNDEFSVSMRDKRLKMAGNRVLLEEATEYGEEEEEDEELNNNYDDVDEEDARSTTEYTTNDEMDLESASVSVRANLRHSVNPNYNNSNNANRVGANNTGGLASALNSSNNYTNNNKNNKMIDGSKQPSSSIDDYLVQNLKKEEILAAKMSKFLSVI